MYMHLCVYGHTPRLCVCATALLLPAPFVRVKTVRARERGHCVGGICCCMSVLGSCRVCVYLCCASVCGVVPHAASGRVMWLVWGHGRACAPMVVMG